MYKKSSALKQLSAIICISFSIPGLANFQPVSEASLTTTDEMVADLHRAFKIVKYLHYNNVEVNDDLSSSVFYKYLEQLDPNKHYFYASDIEQFKVFEHQIDNHLKDSNPDVAFRIYKVLRKRVAEREQYAKQQLAEGFNFSIDEEHSIDRSEASWPANKAEMNELWRKSIKNKFLTYKSEGVDKIEINTKLQKQFTRNKQNVWQTKPEEVFEVFLNSYMKEFGPHTQYMSRVTAENFRINMSLSLEGIGASLQTEEDHTIVKKVIVGGAADKAGNLNIEDKVVGVGQSINTIEDVTGWRLMDVVSKIRGRKGTPVFLKTISADTAAGAPPKIIKIVRDVINLADKAAKLEYQTINDKKFAVIEIPSFYARRNQNNQRVISTSGDVERLIYKAQREGNFDGLIIDLRQNGGGYLGEAIRLTGLFIDQGPVLQVQDQTAYSKVYKDTVSGVAYTGPLAVLIDKNSASASEIFSGAIKDYGRGLIIGERSFGKGTVQEMRPLNRKKGGSGSTIKFTTQQFFRVNGSSTQGKGIEPDITLNINSDYSDYGESSLENALPWKKIKAAKYYSQDLALNEKLSYLHKLRAENNPSFTFLQQSNELFKRNKQVKSVPLSQEKRTLWFKQREKESIQNINAYREMINLAPLTSKTMKDASKDLPNGENHWDRVYQKEAAYILNDYIDTNEPANELAQQDAKLKKLG